jgi:type VI secretion system protein ImpL
MKSRAALARSEKVMSVGIAASISPIKALNVKFKEAIEQLRNSSLKRFGKPIYVLPWYLVIGESGAGKTTAITRSRLNATIKRVNQSDPVLQTVNCDWWFFNKAVVIDTAGRYIAPNGLPEDIAEWENLLDLLAKYRSKEGINGLILVIDVDRLIKKDLELLQSEGKVLRERIDQLMRLFDKRFPVYVLVTKCDHITGFDAWTEALQEQQFQQAMGYLGSNKDGDGSEANFLDLALNKIQERLRQIRLGLAIRGVSLTSTLLSFPTELERLRPGLRYFLSACLGDNPYLEHPLLRGIFFSSGKQTGELIPSELSKLVQVPAPRQKDSHKGIFLHDFFGSVIPSDRSSALPTVVVNKWRKITKNIGLVSWMAFNLAALIFVLVSYVITQKDIEEIRTSYLEIGNVQSIELSKALFQVDLLRKVVDLINSHEQKWTGKWLAFSPNVNKIEDIMKAQYVNNLQLINGRVGTTAKRFKTLLDNPDGPQYANAILGTVRRVNLVTAASQGATYEELMKMPLLPPELIYALYPEMPKDNLREYNNLLVAYIAWNRNDIEHSAELENDRAVITKKTFETPRMEWLLDWADGLPNVRPVTLRSFWLTNSISTEGIKIRPALTRAGEKRIQEFLNELDYMFQDKPEFKRNRKALESWYTNTRFTAWNAFSWSFSEGQKLIVGEPAWRELVSKLNTEDGPYSLYFNRLHHEFSHYAENQLPDWLLFALSFHNINKAKPSGEGIVNHFQTYLATFNMIGGQSMHNSLEKNAPALPTEIKKYIDSSSAFEKYRDSFQLSSGEALSGDGKSYQLAKDFFLFSVDPAVKESKLNTAFVDFKKFREIAGHTQTSEQVVWQLVGGPLEVLISYILEQASCYVEKDWQKNVAWRTQMAISNDELNNQLYGPQGSVWSFLDGAAKPFIQQRNGQVSLAQVNGFTLPFTTNFLPFSNNSINSRVDQMIKEQNFESIKGKASRLTITAIPTGVNIDAKAKPFFTTLSIQCAKGETILNNINAPSSTSVNWSPSECGDVRLQIKIDNLVLTKRYTGPLGLFNFIKEFQNGTKVFTPNDFYESVDQLDELNVRNINVNYIFDGKEDILTMGDMFKSSPQAGPIERRNVVRLQAKVPEVIGQCWADGKTAIVPSGSIQKIMQDRVDKASNPVTPPRK